MSEIKLGWYRSETDGYCQDLELLAIRGDNRACVWGGGGLFTVHIDIIGRREYLGTELPKKGKWVDFDPAKFNFGQLPITGRASNDGIDWYPKDLIGYIKRDHHPFVTDVLSYKLFQIWEAE